MRLAGPAFTFAFLAVLLEPGPRALAIPPATTAQTSSANPAQPLPLTATPPGPASSVTESQPYTNQYQGEYFTSDLKEVFRITHIEGDGQGDVPAYTHLGFTKFAWTSDGVVLFDLAARVTDDAEGGFTAGIHRRVIANDMLLGGGVFYDWQQEFQQGSVAFELFTEDWSFRTNGYFVLGEHVETQSEYEPTAATNIFFQGNNILANNLELEKLHRVALNGIDMEIARHFGAHPRRLLVDMYSMANSGRMPSVRNAACGVSWHPISRPTLPSATMTCSAPISMAALRGLLVRAAD